MKSLEIKVWSGRMWLDGSDAVMGPVNPDSTEIELISCTGGGFYEIVRKSPIKDDNGFDIYEGDILKAAVIDDEERVFECPSLEHFHWWQELEDAKNEGKPVKIIGNVFEHPNLLKNLSK